MNPTERLSLAARQRLGFPIFTRIRLSATLGLNHSLPGERIGYVYVPASAEQSKEVYSAIVGAGRKLGYVCAPSLRNLGYTCVVPGGTFYLFPKSLDEDDVAFARAAQKMDLLLVPGSSFGCPGHVRISYCVPTEQIERSLAVFSRLAKKYLRG